MKNKKFENKISNFIDESADSRLNWDGIISKSNHPCGFILPTYMQHLYNHPLFVLVTELSKKIILLSLGWSLKLKVQR